MTRTLRARATAATLTAGLLTFGLLTGCTGDGDDGPTPSPTATLASPTATPTVTTTLSEQDQNIADAKNAYLAWVAAYDAAAQAGFVDVNLYTALLNLTGGGDARTDVVATQATFEEFGLKQTGSSVVRTLEATGYQEDTSGAGMHGVTLLACVDLSAVDFVYPDGASSSTGDYRGPRPVDVQMLRQASVWVVQSADARPEERC